MSLLRQSCTSAEDSAVRGTSQQAPTEVHFLLGAILSGSALGFQNTTILGSAGAFMGSCQAYGQAAGSRNLSQGWVGREGQ